MRDHPIWILVADGQHSRILERTILDGPWTERGEYGATHPVPPSRELGTERPGRVHESVGQARHGVSATDLHEAEEEKLARALAERLEGWVAEGLCRRLFLMAPPRFLGHLRAALGPAARQALRGTLDKDFCRAPVAEIVAHLHEHRPA